MSTFAAVKARIADDLNRSDLTSQISQHVLLAIQHFKSERTWFNETTTSLTGTIGQSYITAPSDILTIDMLYVTVSGRNIEMLQKDLNEVIEFRPVSNGVPRAFCFYQNRFELDIPCAAAYTFPLYYLKELAALSGNLDENGWISDAEDLIVFRAEKMLYAAVIKDMEKAKLMQGLETDALRHLRSMGSDRTMNGYAKAYYL